MYPNTLEQHRKILMELNPLFSSIKKIEEELIDLYDVRGVDDRAI